MLNYRRAKKVISEGKSQSMLTTALPPTASLCTACLIKPTKGQKNTYSINTEELVIIYQSKGKYYDLDIQINMYSILCV